MSEDVPGMASESSGREGTSSVLRVVYLEYILVVSTHTLDISARAARDDATEQKVRVAGCHGSIKSSGASRVAPIYQLAPCHERQCTCTLLTTRHDTTRLAG